MGNPEYQQALNEIDSLLSDAEVKLHKSGQKASCCKGCSYCCYMLIETTWEEAELLADWVQSLPDERRLFFEKRIAKAARERRSFFLSKKSTKRHRHPTRSDLEISDSTCERYFYEKPRACPFLIDNACAAYPVRPSACRLHLVTNPPQFCSREERDGPGFEIPEEVENVREEAAELVPVEDGRWAELSIIVNAVLEQRTWESLKEEGYSEVA